MSRGGKKNGRGQKTNNGYTKTVPSNQQLWSGCRLDRPGKEEGKEGPIKSSHLGPIKHGGRHRGKD